MPRKRTDLPFLAERALFDTSFPLEPSVLTMRVLQIVSWKKNTTAIHYDLINEQGVAAIQGGVVIFDGVASLL